MANGFTFERFCELDGAAAEAFGAKLREAGYSAFYRFIEQFREELRTYDEAGQAALGAALARARKLFPDVGRFSPSWERIWDDFDRIYAWKNETMAQVGQDEREGEWQVLLDNPNVPQQVVCYPGLRFLDAAYLYAYFRLELQPSEVLRLQKVTGLFAVSGDRSAALLPAR